MVWEVACSIPPNGQTSFFFRPSFFRPFLLLVPLALFPLLTLVHKMESARVQCVTTC